LLLAVDVVGKVALLSVVVVVVEPPLDDEPLLSVVEPPLDDDPLLSVDLVVDDPLLSVDLVVDEPLLSVVVDPPPLDDPESAALLSEEVDPLDDESLLSVD